MTMRPYTLTILVCLALALPSAAMAKKKKLDKPDDKLTCKQITGRMQVKIMELRDFNSEKQASGLSRGIQSGLSATFGNLSHGTDPQGDYAAAIQKLHDYNQRLVAKNCKSYDLNTELAKKNSDDVPTPTIPPAKKAKTKTPAATPTN